MVLGCAVAEVVDRWRVGWLVGGSRESPVLGNEFGVEPQPVQALPSVAHQFCHAAGVEDEGTHHFVQFEEEVFLLLGQLLGLVPHLGGVQEVGGDLDVARCHLVDPLRNRDGGAAAAAAAH